MDGSRFSNIEKTMRDCITDYIHFCLGNIVPTTTVCYFPNKLWTTEDLKDPLNKKNSTLKSGDNEVIKQV